MMKRISLFIAANILFIGCFNSKKETGKNKTENTVIKYQYTFSFPESNEDSSIIQYNDTIDVYRDGDFKLYKFPNGYNTVTLDDVLMSMQKKYVTLVSKANEKSGFFFDTSCVTETFKIVNVDSVVTTKAIIQSDIFLAEGLKYFGERKINQDYVKVYAVVKKTSENAVDSVYCYYSEANMGIDYTLSKSIDTVKKMKLYRINMTGSVKNPTSKTGVTGKFYFNYQINQCQLSDADLEYYLSFKKFLTSHTN